MKASKTKNSKSAPLKRYQKGLIVAAIVLALGIGTYILYAPQRHDKRLVADLTFLHKEIGRYVVDTKKLPKSVEDLELGEAFNKRARAGQIEINLMKDESHKRGFFDTPRYYYEICTVFMTSTNSNQTNRSTPPANFRRHNKGRHCFEHWANLHYAK